MSDTEVHDHSTPVELDDLSGAIEALLMVADQPLAAVVVAQTVGVPLSQ